MSITFASGACSCGAVRFRVALPPRFCGHCHCANCRRAHGAAFVTWAGFPSERLDVLDDEALGRYQTDTGATRSFCRRCGTPMFYESPRWAGEVHVARALLDDAFDVDPMGHVYADRAVGWVRLCDELPRLGGESGVEPL